MSWWIMIRDEEIGPMSAEDLRDLIGQGVASPEALVSEDGETWRAAKAADGLFVTNNSDTAVARAQDVEEEPELGIPVEVEDWYVASCDGEQYGPITKTELNDWVAGERITAQCELARGGDGQWLSAAVIYPSLSGQSDEQQFTQFVTSIPQQIADDRSAEKAREIKEQDHDKDATKAGQIVAGVVLAVLALVLYCADFTGNWPGVLKLVGIGVFGAVYLLVLWALRLSSSDH